MLLWPWCLGRWTGAAPLSDEASALYVRMCGTCTIDTHIILGNEQERRCICSQRNSNDWVSRYLSFSWSRHTVHRNVLSIINVDVALCVHPGQSLLCIHYLSMQHWRLQFIHERVFLSLSTFINDLLLYHIHRTSLMAAKCSEPHIQYSN